MFDRTEEDITKRWETIENPVVSVHMLTYNHAPYIAQAIESVLSQKTTFPFELVIGEDCSTDATREIVFDYAQRYPNIIRVITSEQNVGMKKNFLRVNAALRGKYIAWCEGDDYWHKENKLQLQIDYLESHLECGLVCTDYNEYHTKTGVTIYNYLQTSSKKVTQYPDINDILTGNGGVLTCTVTARKELVDKIIADDIFLHQSNHFKMGDTQLWAELAICSKLHRINESLATHNILTESATQNIDRKKVLQFWISNSEMCLYLCHKHNLSTQIHNSHLQCIRRKTLQLAFYEGNQELAKSAIKKYPHPSVKDWVWYWGGKNPLLRYIILLLKPE